jgi:5-methylcytosine-specific restriction enzyme subunit McrC
MNEIPIKNLYYIVLYAFDEVKQKDFLSDKAIEKTHLLSELFIELFIKQVVMISKKGVYKSYSDVEEETMFIRGKIDILKSFSVQKPKMIIQTDQYSEDNSLNQIIKKTLNNILISSTHKRFKSRIKLIYPLFSNVSLIENIKYNQILNRNNEFYRFSLSLAYFINEKVIPSQEEGIKRFVDITRENETMSTLYEAFLRNFYRIHTKYKVSKKQYKWDLTPISDSDMTMLPKMLTDIELEINESTKIIIDAKYYHKALNSRYENQKFCSNNMYQMKAYLDHNPKHNELRGILLYPSNGYDFYEKYQSSKNYTIEFSTINLSNPWAIIEEKLLKIII